MKAVVVIPVYKAIPSVAEIASLNQCLTVLYRYPIVLMTFRELDLGAYLDLFSNRKIPFDVAYFDKKWFSRLRTYSQLLMRRAFYEAFLQYEFIQLYQLDAWVFRDDLMYWCEQGYSFVGAPLADREPFCVGNGGFSLRKTKDCLKILGMGRELERRVPYDNPRLHDSWAKLNWKGIVMAIARWFGVCRTYRYFLECSTLDEDAFWGTMAPDLEPSFRVPEVNVAMKYSWDAKPRLFFQRTGGLLPFGCHAWGKWDSEFWKEVGLH